MKCPSKQSLDQLNIVLKSFIWDNKKPKIKHSTLIADYSEAVGIETKVSALKVTWVKMLLNSNFHSWKIIPTIDEYSMISLSQGNTKLEYNGGFRAQLGILTGIRAPTLHI